MQTLRGEEGALRHVSDELVVTKPLWVLYRLAEVNRDHLHVMCAQSLDRIENLHAVPVAANTCVRANDLVAQGTKYDQCRFATILICIRHDSVPVLHKVAENRQAVFAFLTLRIDIEALNELVLCDGQLIVKGAEELMLVGVSVNQFVEENGLVDGFTVILPAIALGISAWLWNAEGLNNNCHEDLWAI